MNEFADRQCRPNLRRRRFFFFFPWKRHYAVQQLRPGKYLNSPKRWHFVGTLTAHDSQQALDRAIARHTDAKVLRVIER